MDSRDYANLIYLLLLGTALVGWFVIQNRSTLRRSVQHAGIWVLIFFGVIAVIGLWDDISRTIRPTQSVFTESRRVEVPRAPDGHYYLTLGINDVPIRFVVDTGASNMVLTREAARRIGLHTDDLAYVGRAATANGDVRTAPVTLNRVTVGPIVDRNVPAFVNEGEMFDSLLGMSYLRRWSRIEIADGKLVLTR